MTIGASPIRFITQIISRNVHQNVYCITNLLSSHSDLLLDSNPRSPTTVSSMLSENIWHITGK